MDIIRDCPGISVKICVRSTHTHTHIHTQSAAQVMHNTCLQVTCSQGGHLVSIESSHLQQSREQESCLISSLLQPSLHQMLQPWEGLLLKGRQKPVNALEEELSSNEAS